MALLGKGALVMLHGVKPGMDADHDDWHSMEHIPERIGIPGFRRGRRCRSVDDESAWFLMYEVDDLDVLSSAAYRERLNHPSEWSQRIIPAITNMNRTLAEVEESIGIGVGGFIAAAMVGADIDRNVLRDVVKQQGIIGAHLLRGDRSASVVSTEEKSLREVPDEVADWIVVLEGYDLAAVKEQSANLVGVLGLDPMSCYQVRHVVSENDLSAP